MKKSTGQKEQAPSLVWASPEQGHALIERMAKSPEAVVAKLAGSLKEENDNPTVVASFALEGLVHRSLDPGQEKLRNAIAAAMAEQLPKVADATARCILLSFLRLLAVPSTTAAVAEWLFGDARERSAALGVLQAINTRDAYEEIWKAAWLIPSRLVRAEMLEVVLAFTDVSQEYLDRALKFAGPRTDLASRMVWPGLARQGALLLLPVLYEAAASPKSEIAGLARSAFLRILKLAPEAETRRLLASKNCPAGEEQESLRGRYRVECKKWALCFQRRYGGVQGMESLLRTFGECEENFGFLLQLLGDRDSVLRAAAVTRLATGFPGPEATQRIVAALHAGKSHARQRAALVKVLGERRDVTALPCVAAALRDPEAEVRAAAVEALAQFPSGHADGRLLSVVARVES